MKKIWTLLLIALLGSFALSVSAQGNVSDDGYFKGIRLAGRVKVVNSFPDIRVKIVNSFPDLRVKTVTSFPDDIGEWQFVEHGEDFKIQFVDSFPDITIRFVTSFPGVE
jgi:hypothetical protein